MTKIQLRHDTAANFASENPILLAGEVAIETDTNKIKIGDGVTAYNSLAYFAGGSSVIVDQTYDATSTNAQSGTAVAEAVEDKVDNSELVDISELYSILGELGKPSSAYTDLTFTSGIEYTAPASGYFVACRSANSGEYFNMYNRSTGSAGNIPKVATGFNAPSTGQYRFWLPVAKGDVVYIGTNFSASSATYDYFGFVYDKGSESEAS